MTGFPPKGDNFTTLGPVSGVRVSDPVMDSVTRQIAEKAIARAESDGDTDKAEYLRKLYRGWLTEDGGGDAA